MYSLGSSSSLTVVGSHATSGQDQDSSSSQLSLMSSNGTSRPSGMVYEFSEKACSAKKDSEHQYPEAQAHGSQTSVQVPLRVYVANRAWKSGYSSSNTTNTTLERLTIAALTLHELSRTPISRKVGDVAYVGRMIQLLDDVIGVHEDVSLLKSRREGMVRRMVESRGVLSDLGEDFSLHPRRGHGLSEMEGLSESFAVLESAFEQTIELLARCIPQSYTEEIGMFFFFPHRLKGEIERCEELWGRVRIKFQAALGDLDDEKRVS